MFRKGTFFIIILILCFSFGSIQTVLAKTTLEENLKEIGLIYKIPISNPNFKMGEAKFSYQQLFYIPHSIKSDSSDFRFYEFLTFTWNQRNSSVKYRVTIPAWLCEFRNFHSDDELKGSYVKLLLEKNSLKSEVRNYSESDNLGQIFQFLVDHNHVTKIIVYLDKQDAEWLKMKFE